MSGIHESQPVPGSLVEAPAKQSYRSFKKKYAKLKIKFELGIKESEELVREEMRIEELSKRIQAQNDQLLEVLLEFNDNLHLSPSLRFGLDAPDDTPSLPTPEREFPAFDDSESATVALRSAKADLEAGRIMPDDYRDLEDAVKRGRAFAPEKQYTSLLKVPHTASQAEEEYNAGNGNTSESLGYFNPDYENEYYLGIDARLGDGSAALQLERIPKKPAPSDRDSEVAVRNPVSVYSWLRREQPSIFRDDDNASEKSGLRPSNQRSSKKAQQARKEEDDEDSASIDTVPASNSKNKRKRDDDTGYRPKGGSSRSRKKKDDGGASSRRASKRASGVGA
ncbi:uncharacterized protein ACHE_70515S [Aspergillus chevalieri]|uniref:IEC3 subunit of the Ino80 complex, chromatin re-modelling-domain-containing protein n=1 Tax=Aspergillus chevalieri TaxID=182096 RepID=A0A7R7VVQ6_ASPCH|nr:uncharacterized protein ACHE_70515S [Aspergillus chevalieri]BCR91672.1 hypothetical protein ACHE_70515S [Aspergillus chevalieri]